MSQFCWENCIRKKQVVAEPGSKRSTQVDVCTGEGTAAQNSRVLELFLCPCRQWSQHLAESRDPGDQPDHLQPAAVRPADATHDVCGDPDGRCGCVPGRQAVRQHWFSAVSRSCPSQAPCSALFLLARGLAFPYLTHCTAMWLLGSDNRQIGMLVSSKLT